MSSNEPKSFSSVSYSAAPTSESTTDAGAEPMTVYMSSAQPAILPTKPYTETPNFKVLRLPDKSRRTCCQKWALYSCLVGFIFIIASVIW